MQILEERKRKGTGPVLRGKCVQRVVRFGGRESVLNSDDHPIQSCPSYCVINSGGGLRSFAKKKGIAVVSVETDDASFGLATLISFSEQGMLLVSASKHLVELVRILPGRITSFRKLYRQEYA